MLYKSRVTLAAALLFTLSLPLSLVNAQTNTYAQETQSAVVTADQDETEWTDLLDESLSKWETWIGVPHSGVTGLPEGTFQSDDVTQGSPMGLGNDVKNVFSTKQEDGDVILHVTGEIYGGLTTTDSHQNYHLQMQHRWGEKRWPPRANTLRDSGVLYHCQGEHGSFWKVWKSCVEYQVQEKDYGDLYLLAGPKAQTRASSRENEKKKFFDPEAEYGMHGGISASSEPDLPNGQWNTIDIYVVGDAAIHMVNGVVVLAIKDAKSRDGKVLDKGQIQIQSEAAECDYRNIRMRPIESFPEGLAKAANM